MSWMIKGNLNCIIGPGDTCKTTILAALDYALSPRVMLTFDDSDFFSQDVSQSITIQVTLSDWNEDLPEINELFRESKFAQHKCGLGSTGPVPEPQEGAPAAISVSLRIDKSLEPKWFVVKGLDEDAEVDAVPIYAADRAILGLSRLDTFSDIHFTWARNTILTRLSADSSPNLGGVLSSITRDVRQSDVSSHEGIVACQKLADSVRDEAQQTGVRLTGLSPRIDLQRQSMSSGAISLHEDNVPLRNKGNGTKRLISAAMQMMLYGGKNIALIDEIEMGLEPHRIRGILIRLRSSGQQIFTTTHSPVVLRELFVEDEELYVCRRDKAGNVTVEGLAAVPDIQGSIRSNAEAFLGSKIVACEGLTEIGCLRAYDRFRFSATEIPIWSLDTSYYNANGGSGIKASCPKLLQLGYKVAAFCDNDAKDQISEADANQLRATGVHVCQWGAGNATENQLFNELPWMHIPALLELMATNLESELSSMSDTIVKDVRLAELKLSADPARWPESDLLRRVIGDKANDGKWIKRIDRSARAFSFALPKIPDTATLKIKLAALWTWIQMND